MDKLRGMEYLIRAVEARSFAAAARELDVSAPAVTQMIAALEKQLGTTLLVRGPKGVTLTPDGEQYYRICARTMADLRVAEANLRAGRTRASGQLVVGMSRRIARNCIMPEVPGFLARHPDLSIDVRSVHTTEEPIAALVDIMVINAWDHSEDMIGKDIAQMRYLTCAAPAYWRAHGVPQDPDDLQRHVTLAFRTSQGRVLDEWKYRRGKVVKPVAIKPRLVCDDRDAVVAAAIAGCGVLRTADLTIWPILSQGQLVPVLKDWEALETPPIRLLYRRGTGSSARVRAFAVFVEEVFARLRTLRSAAGYDEPEPQPAPSWFRRLNRSPRETAAARG